MIKNNANLLSFFEFSSTSSYILHIKLQDLAMYRCIASWNMKQIKLFMDQTPDMEKFEKKVNDFLKENDGKIEVRDIKYTAESQNPNNRVWRSWTVMVVYDVK